MDLVELQQWVGTMFGALPEKWVAVIGGVYVVLGALRTLLRGVVAVCSAIDLADGERNWAWVGAFGDKLDAVDAYLAKSRWYPAKALGLPGRK